MRDLLLLAAGQGIPIPLWLGYVIAALGVLAALVFIVIPWLKRDAKVEAEYQSPTEPVVIGVKVRGASPEVLARFARCWNHAFEMIAAHGPWPREELLKRLNTDRTDVPANRVHVMPTATWDDGTGQKVGGQLVAGLLIVGPNLDVLCHELVHRCEEVLDTEHRADNSHVTWQGRGLRAADEAYRAWLAKQPA